MKEEKNGGSKKWSRIFRKKWFFPAVYLTVAALLLTFVVWYQNVDNQVPGAKDNQETTDNTATDPYNEDAETVTSQQEVVKMPVSNMDQAEIVTKFYDYNADDKVKESALVLFQSRYYQSTGVDIAASESEGETFDVTASLSGTVEEVTEDPLLGNVVILSHDKELKTYYASLGEVNVKKGADVKQGDVLGTAGQNLFGKDAGTHVHFEIRKNEKPVNPEAYFNQPVSSIKEEAKSDDVEKDSKQDSEEESTKSEEETSGTEDDATNSDDGSGTKDDPVKQDELGDTQDDDATTPDDSTNQDDGMSDEGSETSSTSSASA